MVNITDYLNQKPKSLLLILGIIAVIPIGILNYLMGVEISFSILYLIPVALVSWCGGKREGGFTALVSSVVWYVAEWTAGREYSHPIIYYWNMAVMFGFFFVVSFTLSGLKTSLEKEKRLARVDSLTGVANVRYFSELAQREIERSRRYLHPLTLVYLDCDNFKAINDHFGHQAGDRLLRSLAAALQSNTRTTDIIVRLGGDEFAVLMPETGDRIVPQALERLQSRLSQVMRQNGWPITFSLGVAIYLVPPDTVEEMIRSADRLMFLAKNDGKNRIKYQIFGTQGEDLTSSPTATRQSLSEPLFTAPIPTAAPDGLFQDLRQKSADSSQA